MGALGVVDDRDDLRRTVRHQIEGHAGSGVRVVDTRPLASPKEYPAWIVDKGIAGLIVDERLGEQRGAGQKHVKYAGHRVVDVVRAAHPNLPIFVLTSFPGDPGVQSRFGKVEDILDRRLFMQAPRKHVQRIVRAASHYSAERDAALAQLSTLSTKIAAGNASATQRSKARSLQLQLHTPVSIDSMITRSEWLTRAEKELAELRRLRTALKKGRSKK
jgi:hypothetical protein